MKKVVTIVIGATLIIVAFLGTLKKLDKMLGKVVLSTFDEFGF